MAKLVKTFENNIERVELTFRDKTCWFSMLPTPFGWKGNRPGFDIQVGMIHPELADDDDLMELLDNLSSEDSGNEILELLESLADWEDNS
ncbi:MAG TPA: hypothetical protein PKA10_07680 [Selenomonadales bacterium]|nr:hypothetical protein [Selenomonadales bacterium]